MARPKKFYFVLVSEDKKNKLHPSSFRGKELGDFLVLLDDMISSTISNQLGIEYGGLRVESITKGSTCIVCPGTAKQYLAFNAISNEINSGRYTGKNKKNIDKIREFNTTHSARLEFRPLKRGPAIATVVPFTREQSIAPLFPIQTCATLYGKISGINGVSKIRVTLSLVGFSGNVVFSVTRKEDIQQFCSRFGETVGVTGLAEIKLPEREVTHFSFSGLTEYKENPIVESIHEIRRKFGSTFDKIHDIDQLIREQRG